MPAPRFQRRKEDRPGEITAAALAAFAENGYAATRVDDVARRAGVSKGLLYLYFRTKEELFKAVVRSFVVPKIDALAAGAQASDLSATEFLRGPFLEFAKSLPDSPAKILVRLLIAEGPRYPDLIAFYWENVVSQGLAALRNLIARGVRDGEFRPSVLQEFPHLIVSPVMLAVIWAIILEPQEKLDAAGLMEAHVEMLLAAIRLPDGGDAS
ncbi:MAG: TetR/AcrR family transcriptional regulator [Gammaproteobacteria bacterium]|nr:MAG: TetR/AcrR family transcriptional regulator [Gammaproteobacteria bacterium]